VAILVSLGLVWWKLGDTTTTGPVAPSPELAATSPSASAPGAPELQRLRGRWQRLDGGYVVEIRSIAGGGAMEAAYYNPRPIHVARAEASRDGGAIRVLIELRDVNYPGSTYTLTYDPASDQLRGIYYQAVERQRFPVALVRMR
jgi:hypothetical protein